jgi:transposase-like protein
MDRAELQELLEQGLSLAEIGRRHGPHESTIGYWVKKHGLKASRREKHAAKGGLRREDLEALVEAGASIAQIAEALDRSRATVRHWLREYGIKTRAAERQGLVRGGQIDVPLECRHHGVTTFRRRDGGGYRCLKCRSEAVAARRRKVKAILVREAGGCCQICGYDRCIAALEFHHVVPAEKSFELSRRGVARSLEKARAEARKCVLLCANCHAEVEAGLQALP